MEDRRTRPEQARAVRARRSRQRSRRRQNRAGMLSITGIVFVLLVAMSVQIFLLYQKNEDYKVREKQLTAELRSEEERSKEIAAYEEYVATPEYIEQIAKTKLGLIYANEIIFKELVPEQ